MLQELEGADDDFCEQQMETLERLRTQLELCERLQLKREYIQQYKAITLYLLDSNNTLELQSLLKIELSGLKLTKENVLELLDDAPELQAQTEWRVASNLMSIGELIRHAILPAMQSHVVASGSTDRDAARNRVLEIITSAAE